MKLLTCYQRRILTMPNGEHITAKWAVRLWRFFLLAQSSDTSHSQWTLHIMFLREPKRQAVPATPKAVGGEAT